eukprot:355110-Chlamydomonas_euryale.AAC.2
MKVAHNRTGDGRAAVGGWRLVCSLQACCNESRCTSPAYSRARSRLNKWRDGSWRTRVMGGRMDEDERRPGLNTRRSKRLALIRDT